MNRLDELLYKKNQFLEDRETVIYVKDNGLIVMWNDEEHLVQVSGNANDKLKIFLDWLYDDDQY